MDTERDLAQYVLILINFIIANRSFISWDRD
jgi:hypothetical protein